jgi:hypothetical protein
MRILIFRSGCGQGGLSRRHREVTRLEEADKEGIPRLVEQSAVFEKLLIAFFTAMHGQPRHALCAAGVGPTALAKFLRVDISPGKHIYSANSFTEDLGAAIDEKDSALKPMLKNIDEMSLPILSSSSMRRR